MEVCVCACSSVFKPVVKCALQLQQQQLIQRQQQQQQKHLQHTLIRLPDRAKEPKNKTKLKLKLKNKEKRDRESAKFES